MRAATEFFTHFVCKRTNVRSRRAFDDKTRDGACDLGKFEFENFDFDGLQLHAPEVVYDLPAGGRRLIQRATGYTATIVNGVITRRDGVDTGARPGRLVRRA